MQLDYTNSSYFLVCDFAHYRRYERQKLIFRFNDRIAENLSELDQRVWELEQIEKERNGDPDEL